MRGHSMLTRGTILSEALAAGTGMYIADIAIYMQARWCGRGLACRALRRRWVNFRPFR